jgi:hypothetical protein
MIFSWAWGGKMALSTLQGFGFVNGNFVVVEATELTQNQ